MKLQFAKKKPQTLQYLFRLLLLDIAFANVIRLFFLICDEAELEFRIIIADWNRFSGLV